MPILEALRDPVLLIDTFEYSHFFRLLVLLALPILAVFQDFVLRGAV